jgi:3-oxoacyl-[acyl-carrier protein] reductase
MNFPLTGKIAVITGASRGIGAAIAQELAQQGADLLLTGTSNADLKKVAADVRSATGRRVCVFRADLASAEAGGEIVDAALSTFSHLDILVNCAGATRTGHVLEMTDDDWHAAFEVKFHGALRTCRAAWPHLRRSRGSIVIIAGNTARTGRFEYAINGSVNAALLNLTKALADLGSREGVRVNAINPGRFSTRRLTTAVDRIVARDEVDEETARKRLLEASGIPRFGDPSEIGWLVAYLSSKRADFIQGAVIDIDGGETRAV